MQLNSKVFLVVLFSIPLARINAQAHDTVFSPVNSVSDNSSPLSALFMNNKSASLTDIGHFADFNKLASGSIHGGSKGSESNLFGMAGFGLVALFGFFNLRSRRRA